MKQHEYSVKKNSSYYKVLGVSRDADAGAIKTAYKTALADLNAADNSDEDWFKTVNKAYSVLCDENMRRRYNNALDSNAACANDETVSAESSEPESVRRFGDKVTVYTINEAGSCYTEKVDKSELPAAAEGSVYVLSIGGGKRTIVAKELWNKWLDLCDILKSKNAICGSVEDVKLNVELIYINNGEWKYTKTLRSVSQLPISFPAMVDELGVVYAYLDKNGCFRIMDKYEWKHLRHAMDGRLHSRMDYASSF